ncbi:unnamed protein product [Bathycoccus prasinos]
MNENDENVDPMRDAAPDVEHLRLEISENGKVEGVYEANEFEKSAWNLAYSPESIKKKGGDPCKVGWPGPECPKVRLGKMDLENALLSDFLIHLGFMVH